ncbi:Homoserine kinase [Sparassis crispa]|uniref:Homoserine kinase n=1 Tax=Sparassis crispa TaxID=139825 RepID=A0A401GQX4_9APHY|nr:Homoserine kinase [Sparassis crispa]GBE84612.1 Homoserine kinase [Sparassis crispa]
MMSHSFTVRVPVTSANIGPGFDVVGLPLSLYLTLSVTVTPPALGDPPHPPRLLYTGEGADELPLDAYKNLTTHVALYVLRCHRALPRQSLHPRGQIPFGRGLGSSGAAVIAGVLLADAVCSLNLSRQRVLDFGLMVERHPDNVTAALVGGFVGSYLRELDHKAEEAALVPLSKVLPEYPPDEDPRQLVEMPDPEEPKMSVRRSRFLA